MRTYLWRVVSGTVGVLLPTISQAGSYEWPGVGAKALSMGGAFVGVADDWTAAYWNPAGLAQLQGSGVGFSLSDVRSRTLDGDSMGNPTLTQINAQQEDTFLNLDGTEPSHFNGHTSKMHVPIPALGAYHRWGGVVASASFFAPLGFSSEVTDSTLPGLAADFRAKGYILMSGLSAATQLSEKLYVGAGVHLLSGHLDRHATKTGPSGYTQSIDSDASGVAPQGVLGLLMKPLDHLQVGLVYRTPPTMRLSGAATVSDTRFPFPAGAPFGTLQNESSNLKSDVYSPATYAVGLAIFPATRWTLSTDWQGTDWRPARDKVTYDTPGILLQSHDTDAHWKFTNRFRVGGEYRRNEHLAFRGGFFVDPQALPDEAQSITGQVDITRYFVTTGMGWQGTSFSFGFGYEYGWGHKTINGVKFTRESHNVINDVSYHF